MNRLNCERFTKPYYCSIQRLKATGLWSRPETFETETDKNGYQKFFEPYRCNDIHKPMFVLIGLIIANNLEALVFLYAFEESVECHLLSSFCDNSNVRISLFKYVLSTTGVSKESISEFLIGNRNRFPIKNLLIDSLLTPIVESTS